MGLQVSLEVKRLRKHASDSSLYHGVPSRGPPQRLCGGPRGPPLPLPQWFKTALTLCARCCCCCCSLKLSAGGPPEGTSLGGPPRQKCRGPLYEKAWIPSKSHPGVPDQGLYCPLKTTQEAPKEHCRGPHRGPMRTLPGAIEKINLGGPKKTI